MLEATTLPTESQPLPSFTIFLIMRLTSLLQFTQNGVVFDADYYVSIE